MAGASFWTNFELRQVRCFVAVAEELHFGRAAARMNITQPPLSRHIQVLEHVLGVTLLERNTRAVRLTPAGRVFLVEARRILSLTQSAALATRRVASGEMGSITLGFTAAICNSYLPTLLLRRAARLPNVDVALKEMVSADQVEGLLIGGLDVGLLRPPINRSELNTIKVNEERLVAALPMGDPRLNKGTLTLKDFDRLPLITYASGSALHRLLTGLFESAGVLPISIQSLSQTHSILSLVRAGIGAAVVPEGASTLHLDDVFYRPIETNPIAPVELFAAWRNDNNNPALSAFLELLQPEVALELDELVEQYE